MDHKGKDTHLGGTAVVELDGELLVNGLSVPARCLQLGSLDIILASGIATLNDGNSQDSSEDGLNWEGSQGGKPGWGRAQVIARGEGSGKAVSSSGHQVAKDSKLGNAAVLGLDKAKAIESFLIGISKKTKRIPEAKRGLSELKSVQIS